MKRFLLIALLAVVSVAASAQIASTRYKDLKKEYNSKLYEKQDGDPYSPGFAAAVGFFYPGTSQLVMHEPVRGLIFFLGSAFCVNQVSDYAEDLSKLITTDSEGNYAFSDNDAASKALVGMLAFGVADLVIAIWSSIDAKKVAKVKNMYYQDLAGRQAMQMSIRPSVNLAATPSGIKPAPGMALSLNF